MSSVPPTPPPPPSYTPPPPPTYTPPPGGGQSSNRTLMIVLSYLWILAIVPLVMEKEDREVQWHAKHGLVLLVLDIIAVVLINIVGFVIANFDLGCTGCVLWSVFWVADLVVRIVCIVKGVNGQRFIIPGVSQYADRF